MSKVKFGDIVREVKVNVDRENNPYEFYVAGDHMDSEDLTIRRKGRFDTDDVGPAFTRIFRPGQILYGSRRTYLKKVAVADFEGICANTTFVLESKDPNVFCQELLPFIMLSDEFSKWSIGHSKGSTNPYVLFSDLAGYEFNLPSIEEQKVLADKLWAAYKVKESYRQLLSTTDEMLKAKFQEMFGDGKYSVRLDSVCELFVDGDWIESKDQSTEGIRLVQTGNVGEGVYIDKADKAKFINEETFRRLNCTEIFSGDILISRLPDPIGRACVLPKNLGRTITAVDCTIIRLKKEKMLQSFFIANTLTPSYTKQIYSFILGTTRMRISRNNLASIQIACPPIEEQKRFDEIYIQAEATKASLRASIEAIDRVIRSFINQ